MKPALVIYGDCQAASLAGAIKNTPDIAGRFDVYLMDRPHTWEAAPTASPLGSEVWERCTVFWEQVGNVAVPPIFIAELPAKARRVRFSSLYFGIPWPTYQVDKVMHPGAPKHPIWPYHDRLLTQVSEAGLSGDAAYRRYEDLAEGSLSLLDNLIENNLGLLAKRDTEADVRMAGYIMTNFKTQRLFWTNGGVSGALFGVMLDRLLRASLPADSKPGGALHGLGARVFGQREPFDKNSWPISRAVARHLGLTWWSADYRPAYRQLPAMTLAEYVAGFVQARRAEVERRAAATFEGAAPQAVAAAAD